MLLFIEMICFKKGIKKGLSLLVQIQGYALTNMFHDVFCFHLLILLHILDNILAEWSKIVSRCSLLIVIKSSRETILPSGTFVLVPNSD